MKKIYFSLIGTFLFISGQAQITVTSDNVPSVGDQFSLIQVDAEEVDVSNSGAEQVWDFSTADQISSSDEEYVSPSEATEPENFPMSNLVGSAGVEAYFYKDDSEFSAVGFFVPGFYRMQYSDRVEILKFPLSFGDNYSETFAGTGEDLTSGDTSTESGTIEIEADGYGDLILPYGTIENVLRVLVVVNTSYAVGGETTENEIDTSYYWLNESTSTFLANYNKSYSDLTGTESYSGSYLDEAFVNMEENSRETESGISFYPNPVRDFVIVKNPGKKQNIKIADSSGRIVQSLVVENGNHQVDISSLSAGIYFIQSISRKKPEIHKLIVE